MPTLPTQFISLRADRQRELSIADVLQASGNPTAFENPRWNLPSDEIITLTLFHDDEKAILAGRNDGWGDVAFSVTIDAQAGEGTVELTLPVVVNVQPPPAISFKLAVGPEQPIED